MPDIELEDYKTASVYMHLPQNCPMNKAQRRIKFIKRV